MSALITGGLHGSGLMYSRELAVKGGTERIVAVSRTGNLPMGELEEHMIDAIQENSRHEIMKCDIADGGALSDVLHYASTEGIRDPDWAPEQLPYGVKSKEGEEELECSRFPPQDAHHAELMATSPLHGMDALEILNMLLDCLHSIIENGQYKDMYLNCRLRKLLMFRDDYLDAYLDARDRHEKEPLAPEDEAWLNALGIKLEELDGLVELVERQTAKVSST